uniref:Gamma-glutamyltranspeptidase 1-like n=1 Tax=Sinocyclocheilus grahami TaxID=75366 RepID=A0A672LV69_SINGR
PLNKTVTLYLFAAFVIVLLLILTHILRCDRVTPRDKCYDKAAVAADARNCSEIGRDILKCDGSVVDAAIATLLCLSVVNPHSMGIGGGVVFTIYNASTGTVATINARETAPLSASENMFGKKSKDNPEGLFIAVPGELYGYEMAHNRSGRLPWKELFEPSIKLARDGFKIGKALAKAIKEEEEKIKNDPVLCEVFCDLNKAILKENDHIRFPKLADTYEKIAEQGANAFYNGSLAQSIVDDIKAEGGIITREDLMNYTAEWNEYAVNFTVGNYIFHAPDAPFGGPVLALIFNILKGYLSSCSVSTTENKILTYHRMIETFHFADEERRKLGDPHDENITELVKNMTSESFADNIRRKINDDIKQERYDEECYDNCQVDDSGTSHLSIIGEDGSAVAVTSSINDYFGSKVMSDSTGIIFNDQMNDFCKPKEENGQDKNGVILNYLFFGYDLQKAVKEPRVQITKNETNVEKDFDKGVTDGLKKKNHSIFHNTELTAVQAIVREGDEVCAESDYRKGGYPAGYPEPIL